MTTSARGLGTGTPQHEEMRTRFMAFWDGLSKMADTDKDAKVPLEEWYAFCDQLITVEGMFEEVALPIADFIFNLLDIDGDGTVKVEEYVMMWKTWGLDVDMATSVFVQLDEDQSGHLSTDELVNALDRYFRSDDPDDPANAFFGPVE